VGLEESIRIVRTAIDQSINFIDNCWDYNGGESELRMDKALHDDYREKAFLMTKIDGRNRLTGSIQINDSLRRLQTDRIDLLQGHEVIRDDDPDRIFAPGGALEALLEARKAWKVRYIGFTGHKSPDIHLQSKNCDRRRVPALRHEPADQRGHHWMRFPQDPGPSFECGAQFSGNGKTGGGPAVSKNCKGYPIGRV